MIMLLDPESLFFAASRQAADFTGLLCVRTLNNKMFIDFSFTEPMFPKHLMQKIADEFIKILRETTLYKR